jgi:hypothetical protein
MPPPDLPVLRLPLRLSLLVEAFLRRLLAFLYPFAFLFHNTSLSSVILCLDPSLLWKKVDNRPNICQMQQQMQQGHIFRSCWKSPFLQADQKCPDARRPKSWGMRRTLNVRRNDEGRGERRRCAFFNSLFRCHEFLRCLFGVSPCSGTPRFTEYTSQISMSNISFHGSEESLEINLR